MRRRGWGTGIHRFSQNPSVVMIDEHTLIEQHTNTETYLSTSHQVSACGDDRDRILLNGSGSGVTSVADVLEEHRIQWRVRKLSDRLWNTSTSGLDGDVVVFLEVNASVLLGRVVFIAEELLFHAHVAAAGDVFALPPGTVAEALAGTAVPIARASTTAVPAVGLRAVTPLISTGSTAAPSVAAEASTTVEACVSTPSVSTVSAAERRSGRAGVVPAVPAKGKLVYRGHVASSEKDAPVGRNRGIRGSPLRVPQMRRDISRFCAIDTERG